MNEKTAQELVRILNREVSTARRKLWCRWARANYRKGETVRDFVTRYVLHGRRRWGWTSCGALSEVAASISLCLPREHWLWTAWAYWADCPEDILTLPDWWETP